MKTNRKKMLLSSIAMLLVALVALGSATYAWFSISKSVKATDIKVQAIAAAGLEISLAETSGYTPTSVSFSSTGTEDLKPVTWIPNAAMTNKGFVPSGNIASPGGAYSGAYKDTNVTPTTADNAYFKTYDVYVRSAAEGDKRVSHTVEATVKVNASTKNGDAMVRAYLIDTAPATDVGTAFKKSGGSYNAVGATAGTATAVSTTAFESNVDVSSTPEVASGAAATDAGNKFTLVVWYEGTDSTCVDTNQEATADLQIIFSAKDM